jgi:HlyD family secretion protein
VVRAGVLLGVCAAASLAACSRTEPVLYTGYAEADLVYVSSPASGVVRTLSAERGARVAAGAALFGLDDDAEVYTRNAADAQAKAAVAQAADLAKPRRADEIAALEAQLAQTRATLATTQAQLRRNEGLDAQGFAAAGQLEDLRSARDRDQARLQELQAQLRLAQTGARPDEVAAARAQAEAARATLALERWRQGQKLQAAPAAGLVFDVLYRVGERVPAGNPVVALLPDGALKVRFYVPQADLSSIDLGRVVGVHCDGCAADLRARVSYVSPLAEFTPPVIFSNESRQKLVFLVEARPLAEAATRLKPGQPVQIDPHPPQ